MIFYINVEPFVGRDHQSLPRNQSAGNQTGAYKIKKAIKTARTELPCFTILDYIVQKADGLYLANAVPKPK